MGIRRLAKDNGSVSQGGCPALYSTDEPARLIGQGKLPTPEETSELVEMLDGETAVVIPTETVFRGVAKYSAERGDNDLAGRIEAFLVARGL